MINTCHITVINWSVVNIKPLIRTALRCAYCDYFVWSFQSHPLDGWKWKKVCHWTELIFFGLNCCFQGHKWPLMLKLPFLTSQLILLQFAWPWIKSSRTASVSVLSLWMPSGTVLSVSQPHLGNAPSLVRFKWTRENELTSCYCCVCKVGVKLQQLCSLCIQLYWK